MADTNDEHRLPVPVIRVNDLEVIDGNNGQKRYEDYARRAKRLAAQHDLKNCGCTGRDTEGGKILRHALYKTAKDRSKIIVEAAQLRDSAADEGCAGEDTSDNLVSEVLQFRTARRTFTTEPLPASKRTFAVAFPSSYFDQEACLNFFRVSDSNESPANETQTQELSELAMDDTLSDMDDTMSDAGSDCSVASVLTIDYDFNNSYRGLSYREDEDVIGVAPHKIPARRENRKMLHPVLAVNMKNKKQSTRGSRGIQPQPDHILRSFYTELAQPPSSAFDSVTSGLQREWLHKVRPQFFDSNGELQEYVIHKGKPAGMSQILWLWLCGRDGRLPPHGPDQLALKIAVESAEAFNAINDCSQVERTQIIRGLIDTHGLDIDTRGFSSEAHIGEARYLWDRMIRAEQRQDTVKQRWKPKRVTKQESEADAPELCDTASTSTAGKVWRTRYIPQRSMPEESKTDSLVKSELFREATPEAKQQVLTNAFHSKLRDTPYATKASAIIESLMKLSMHEVCEL